jgi:cation transport regulator ChaB
MGTNMSCLNISWTTQVKELIADNTLPSCKIFGHIDLAKLHKFANAFSEQITAGSAAVFDAVLAKSVFISSVAVKMSGFTFRQLVECSKHVLDSIAHQAMELPFKLRNQLFTQLETIVTTLCSNAKSLTVAETYRNILKEAIEAAKSSYKSKTVQMAQSFSGSVAEEVVESTVKYSRAAQCAKASMKAGVIIDGACLAYSAGKSHMKYRAGTISWEEHRETLMKRTGGAAGSVGMGAVGTFVGTLVFPRNYNIMHKRNVQIFLYVKAF